MSPPIKTTRAEKCRGENGNPVGPFESLDSDPTADTLASAVSSSLRLYVPFPVSASLAWDSDTLHRKSPDYEGKIEITDPLQVQCRSVLDKTLGVWCRDSLRLSGIQ